MNHKNSNAAYFLQDILQIPCNIVLLLMLELQNTALVPFPLQRPIMPAPYTESAERLSSLIL